MDELQRLKLECTENYSRLLELEARNKGATSRSKISDNGCGQSSLHSNRSHEEFASNFRRHHDMPAEHSTYEQIMEKLVYGEYKNRKPQL